MCINTDDPGWFDTDLMTELSIASDLGVDHDTHLRMQRGALAASYAPAAVRRDRSPRNSMPTSVRIPEVAARLGP